MTWRRLLVSLLSLLLGGILFAGALKQRNYVYPELSCPQNPQPIPLSETRMRALQPTLSTLEITLQQLMAKYDIPGMSAGVVSDQTPIWARGFGVTNVSSPSGKRPLRILSFESVCNDTPHSPKLNFCFLSHTKDLFQKFLLV